MPVPHNLNWKEIHAIVGLIKPVVEGAVVERVLIPSRSFSAGGYLKNEWALILRKNDRTHTLVISARARKPYMYLYDGPKLQASKNATWSVFGQSLLKSLVGRIVREVEAIEGDRIARMILEAKGQPPMWLLLYLIPAVSDAGLVTQENENLDLVTSANSRIKLPFEMPTAPGTLKEVELREGFPTTVSRCSAWFESAIASELFEQRIINLRSTVGGKLKTAQKRFKEAQTALSHALSEPDFKRLADLLKGSLHINPPVERGEDGKSWIRKVLDYEHDHMVEIPCDKKLSLQTQIEHYYRLEKRKQTRLIECAPRSKSYEQQVAVLEALFARIAEVAGKGVANLEQLMKLESVARVDGTVGRAVVETDDRGSGRAFISRNGFTILVGRDADENQKLTFRIAKGNDLWMHVRGRPGAHVIVKVPKNTSPPLETMLDAAQLAIHYSGGDGWGKTEVDYTKAKHLKKIKNSPEVTYTSNKTLLVDFDRELLTQLMKRMPESA